MQKLTYFCLNLLVLTKLSRKGLIPWPLIIMRLSAVWYDVLGYDIQSLNMAVCFEILIFFGQSMSC